MHPFLNKADNAARLAGKAILESLKRLDRIWIKKKCNTRGIVTETDLKAEKIIINTIQKAYPHHEILSEESHFIPGEEYIWIIDPLDGTSNYIRDFPHFAISIAIKNKEKDRVEYGLIYDPLRQETFTAERGKGAFLNNTERFSRRLRVNSCTNIQDALIGISAFTRHFNISTDDCSINEFNKEGLRALVFKASGIRHSGSATLDLAYVAAGRLDAAIELRLAPWDIAAGSLLIQEAGGLISGLQGEADYFKTGHVVAANPKLCALLLKSINSRT